MRRNPDNEMVRVIVASNEDDFDTMLQFIKNDHIGVHANDGRIWRLEKIEWLTNGKIEIHFEAVS